jgi:hypothetical protein
MLPIHMGLFKFWFLHLKYEEDYEKIYIYNKPYTHQTNVTKGKYYIDKRCTNMGG